MAKRPTTATKRKAKPTPADRASSKPRTVDPGASGGDVARPAAVDPAVLAEAFDAFGRELDAATIPTPDGGRRVHTIAGADLLNRAAARLSSMLAGTVVAGIGDGLPYDAALMTAFESANRLLALTPKQWNERRPRFAFGDVLTAEQVESIESARRLLAFRADRLRSPDAGAAETGPTDDEQPKALSHPALLVVRALDTFSAEILATYDEIFGAMPRGQPKSTKTIGKAVRDELIPRQLVERPLGKSEGVRLTTKGRRLAKTLGDSD